MNSLNLKIEHYMRLGSTKIVVHFIFVADIAKASNRKQYLYLIIKLWLLLTVEVFSPAQQPFCLLLSSSFCFVVRHSETILLKINNLTSTPPSALLDC